MIEIQNVSYRYQTKEGSLTVLENISLSIAEGEYVSFIGPSGCGKTTLLHLIGNLQELQSGSIAIHGIGGHEIIEKNSTIQELKTKFNATIVPGGIEAIDSDTN